MDTLEPFFVLLRSFIQSCPINQEALLHNDGIAALGVILQKVWEAGRLYKSKDEKVYSLIQYFQIFLAKGILLFREFVHGTLT